MNQFVAHLLLLLLLLRMQHVLRSLQPVDYLAHS
jgi:hypothetical protein